MERFDPKKRYKCFKNGIYNRLLIENTSMCNFNCRHCAYGKKISPMTTMKTDLFENIVNRACNFGFSHFSIAPITGEPLFDNDLNNKIRILEEHDGVDSYYLFTNLSLPNIGFLNFAKKLSYIGISIYGKDVKEFIHITRAKEKYYTNVLNNLNKIKSIKPNISIYINFFTRCIDPRYKIKLLTESEIYKKCIDIHATWKELKIGKGSHIKIGLPRHNWSGLVTKEDTGYDILKPSICKSQCYALFSKNAVTSTGKIIGCGCYDANYETEFGDLKKQSFEEVYNSNQYFSMIHSLLELCHNCSAHEGIYDSPLFYSNTNETALDISIRR
jgi:MoaA/NifB/PqqE/SkfB family radical SAM enzyme